MRSRHVGSPQASAPGRDGEARFSQRGRPPEVLVVDDDPSTVELLAEVASDAGWVARTCGRLAELHEILDRRRPDLLILDDDLPDGRGGDLARQLREDPRMEEVPLLVCTAAHPMRQAEIGAWAPVVSKPFDLREIERALEAVSRRLERRGRHFSAAG